MISARNVIRAIGAPYPWWDRRIEPAIRWVLVALVVLIQPLAWEQISSRLGPGAERPPEALFVAVTCMALMLLARWTAFDFADRAQRAERLAKLPPLQRISNG